MRKTSRIYRLSQQKRKIKIGYDADLVMWNPEISFKLAKEHLFHKHTCRPYIGEKLFGKIEATYCKGKLVFANSEIKQKGEGELILR